MKKELQYTLVPKGEELEDLLEIIRHVEEADSPVYTGVIYGYQWGVIQGKRRERCRKRPSHSPFDRFVKWNLPEELNKETLWREYRFADFKTRNIIQGAFYRGRGAEYRCPLDKETHAILSGGTWPDDETIRRIERVIRGLSPYWVPLNDLLTLAVDLYHLGVMDGKRQERKRKGGGR